MLFPVSSQTLNFAFTDCTDTDSNHYAVVQIGSQLWMQENLKATKYQDGSDIPDVTDSAAWGNLTTGAYCNYHNLPEEGEKYGRLYNYYAITDSRKICPPGWHVPSHGEVGYPGKVPGQYCGYFGSGRYRPVIGRILKEVAIHAGLTWIQPTVSIQPGLPLSVPTSGVKTAAGAWPRIITISTVLVCDIV